MSDTDKTSPEAAEKARSTAETALRTEQDQRIRDAQIEADPDSEHKEKPEKGVNPDG